MLLMCFMATRDGLTIRESDDVGKGSFSGYGYAWARCRSVVCLEGEKKSVVWFMVDFRYTKTKSRVPKAILRLGHW